MAENSLIEQESQTRLGLVGSGFISRGIARAAAAMGFPIGPVLTRNPDSRDDFPMAENLTDSLDNLLENSDLIVECCGDPLHATNVIEAALAAGKPVVTLDSEFHITTGSYFVGKGLLTEAEGDQPGCIAALREEAVALGFEPIVYGNVKGFLNHRPPREDMEFYSGKQGISIEQTTSFTDGTKVQIEQAFCANAFAADVIQKGLLGLRVEDIEPDSTDPVGAGSRALGAIATKNGRPISDYIIVPGNGSVFVTATHNDAEQGPLEYMKMGGGPFYTLVKPYHLCHLEVIKTIRRVIRDGESGKLMDNSATPSASVCTIAKRDLKAGEEIPHGIGSFDVRGEAIRIADEPNHLPIGLMRDIVMARDVADGETLTLDDVQLPDSRAFEVWREIVGK
ncbi:MAG: NAD(P)-dependent oxidoreductase [Verrucomicrobiales bacterium]|nr:NAD(P)-dependent oxidoreductase [Verrucomicrobiales bacterium]